MIRACYLNFDDMKKNERACWKREKTSMISSKRAHKHTHTYEENVVAHEFKSLAKLSARNLEREREEENSFVLVLYTYERDILNRSILKASCPLFFSSLLLFFFSWLN